MNGGVVFYLDNTLVPFSKLPNDTLATQCDGNVPTDADGTNKAWGALPFQKASHINVGRPIMDAIKQDARTT